MTVHEKLAAFTRQLRALIKRERQEQLRRKFPPSIDYKLAEWVADAIEDRLNDKQTSLDRAFGLTAGPGHPKRLARHRKIAQIILSLRLAGTKWADVKRKLEDDHNYHVADERTLRRIYDDFFIDVASAEIQRELKLGGH
jgi:hypothetical protein